MPQIERVTYQRTFNLGNYSSERIGADVLLMPGDSANEALDTARKLVEEWHVKNNPQMYTPDVSVIPKIEPVRSQVYKDAGLTKEEIAIKEIMSCKELKVLESYKFIVKGKPELETAYNNKLKELQ